MIKYDCDEFWQHTIWDRTHELTFRSKVVCREFLQQESWFVASLSELVARRGGLLSVADVGSGPGHIAGSMIKAFGTQIKIALVDTNAAALAEAQRRLGSAPNVAYHLGRICDLGTDFPDAFDVIYCVDILHHLKDLAQVFLNFRRSLRPGGVLLANAFAKDRYAEWDRLKYGAFRSALRRVTGRVATFTYPMLPSAGRTWIRSRGFGRIAPLSLSELQDALSPSFIGDIQSVGYYYCFQGTARGDA